MANLAKRDQEQRVVEVNREQLVTTLKANRESHVSEYKDALLGYREMALKKLQEGYEQAKAKLDTNLKAGRARLEDFDPDKAENASDYLTLVEAFSVELRVPRDYSAEYDAAIDMATWDVRETLELTHAEFQCFVRDKWDWTSQFKRVTEIYNSKM